MFDVHLLNGHFKMCTTWGKDSQGKGMKKDTLSVFIVTTGLFLMLFMGLNLHGCSPDKSEQYSGPVENLQIGVGMYSTDFYGLLFLAGVQGFFKDQGLNISFVRKPSGADAIKALRQGSVDMGMGTEFPFVREVIQGRKLKVITTVWRGDVLYLAARRDRGIQEPADFRGKKIAFTAGTQLEFFLGRYERTMGKSVDTISQRSMEALQTYPWPGNVRELKNVIERMMILCEGDSLHVELPSLRDNTDPFKGMTLAQMERKHILSVLEQTHWRVSGRKGAAEILGLKPSTLNSRMKKLRIKKNVG